MPWRSQTNRCKPAAVDRGPDIARVAADLLEHVDPSPGVRLFGVSVSNLIDRVRLGHVTDFLDFRYWPAFNLADSFIVAGVAILIAALLLADREPRRHAPGSSHRS